VVRIENKRVNGDLVVYLSFKAMTLRKMIPLNRQLKKMK